MALSFGMVGCGKIAQRHAEKMQPYGSLAAVCDVVPAKADALAEKYGCQAFYSLDEMIASGIKPGVLVVCTPNGLHAQHSMAGLNAGMHVLCEKPMAISSADCQKMIDAAERIKRRLFIVKQNRFNPPVAAVKQLLSENKLGKVYSIQLNCFWNRAPSYYFEDDWKGTLALDGGTLFSHFSHFIDLLYWFFGDVKMVNAITVNAAHKDAIEFEDAGAVILQFENGIIGTVNFTINAYRKNMEGSLTIFAENGTVKIGGQYLDQLAYQCIEGLVIKDLPAGNPANDYGTYTGSMSNHDKVYENLNNVLIHGGEMHTTVFEALKTVEIIEKIYASARNR